MQFFEYAHSLGTHVWEIPTLIVVLIMIVMGLVHWYNQRKRNSDFESELENKIQEIKGSLAADAEGKGGV
jgi:sensor domain CHASE-containing protein